MWRKAGLGAALSGWALSACSARGADPAGAGETTPRVLRMTIDASIPGASEEYVCRYFVVSENGFDVAGFEQRLDPNSHHLLLWQTTFAPSDVADRLDTVIRQCDSDAESHAGISGMLYGAQPGKGSLRYPAGAALRLAAGQVVLLEHHLVNGSLAELSTHAEIDLVRAEGTVEAEAGLLHFYDWAIDVPPRSSNRTRMRCAITEPLEIVFLHGHTHERGREFRAWVDRAGDVFPLLDTTRWNAPTQTLSPPFQVLAGDAIEFECSYENSDPIEVRQGTSALNDEMCSLTAGYVAGSGMRMDVVSEACGVRGSGVIGHGSLDCSGIEACIAAAVDRGPDAVEAARETQACWLEGCPAKTIPFLDLSICRVEHCAGACGLNLESAGFVARPTDRAACGACVTSSCADEAADCAESGCGG